VTHALLYALLGSFLKERRQQGLKNMQNQCEKGRNLSQISSNTVPWVVINHFLGYLSECKMNPRKKIFFKKMTHFVAF
jgi:hypothetical protein